MASSKSILFSLLVIFVAISPLAHGLTINGLTITQIQIDGLVACSATGNPPPGGLVGAAGVLVSGMCNGRSGSLGMAVTNTSGFYSVVITTLDGLVFDQGLPCYAVIKLPVTGTTCKAFLPTGTLQAPVTLLSTVQNAVGGVLAIFKAGTYQHLA